MRFQSGRASSPAGLIALGALALLAACQEEVVKVEKPSVRVKATDANPVNYAPVLSLTGEIAARTESNVSFRTGGRVSERMVDVGDHVEAGTLLARIDPQEQQADIRAAQASVDAAQANLRQATAAFQRQETLLKQGFTTRSQYDQAQQSMQVAQSSLEAAQSQLQNAKDALGYTELLAPAAGVITGRSVETGQVVQAAQTIYTIAEDGDRDAIFYVNEALAANSPPDPDVAIALIGNPKAAAMGKVREIAPVIDQATGTIRVKVGIANTPASLPLGAAVTGSITVRAAQAIILPWQALYSDRGQPAVWTIDRGTKAVSLTRVGVMSYNSGTMAINRGLAGGQLVVTAGGQLLRPGQIVEIATEPAK
ncbi:MAG: efflux RND transporter periplasmic adaptor subunit [Rhizobiaceae bacterium]